MSPPSPWPNRLLRASCVAFLALGCQYHPSKTPDRPTLATVRVPAGANLSGTRGVDVRIQQMAAIGSIDLVRPDGKVVYSRRLKGDRVFVARAVVPTKDQSLTAVQHVVGVADQSLVLRIEGGLASGSFR